VSTAEGSASLQQAVHINRLTCYLAAQPSFCNRLPIQAIQRIGKGQSNLTFRLTLADGTVILRRPPLGPIPPTAHDVLREFRVLSALVGSRVPVPLPFLACTDPAIIGAPFYLMEDLPGDAIRFALPPHLASAPREIRRMIGEQVVDALAALHLLQPVDVGLANLGKPTGYMARQLRRWSSQLEYARVRALPDLEWTATWLTHHIPPDVEQARIVHGDYKLDNVIFSLTLPPQLLGVVDWELATLGDPLADLGWLLAFWREVGDPVPTLPILPRITELPGFPTRAALVERYAQRTGWPIADLRYYVVFALWKMAVVLEGHWARHVRGTASEFNFAYLETAGPAFAALIRRIAEGTCALTLT
jgi:aminoglycoside phosphotransferase (APT) family kinase protein